MLDYMKQYYIERDVFCKIVNETIGHDKLLDIFYLDKNFSDSFIWFRIEDEYYIIHLDSGMMINWYKHLGRTNTCSQNRTISDYYDFFFLLNAELNEE